MPWWTASSWYSRGSDWHRSFEVRFNISCLDFNISFHFLTNIWYFLTDILNAPGVVIGTDPLISEIKTLHMLIWGYRERKTLLNRNKVSFFWTSGWKILPSVPWILKNQSVQWKVKKDKGNVEAKMLHVQWPLTNLLHSSLSQKSSSVFPSKEITWWTQKFQQALFLFRL